VRCQNFGSRLQDRGDVLLGIGPPSSAPLRDHLGVNVMMDHGTAVTAESVMCLGDKKQTNAGG
jgi:hypothetical protein